MDIYHNLTLQQTLKLGNLHNIQTDNMKLGFVDKVKQARQLMYHLEGKDEQDEPPLQTPKNFRAKFLQQLCLENKVKIKWCEENFNQILKMSFFPAQSSSNRIAKMTVLTIKDATHNY